MDPDVREYLDRMFSAIANHFEVLETRILERFDRLEARVESMDRRTTDGFSGMNERFATLELRLDHLAAGLADVRAQVSALSDRVDAIDRRLGLVVERVERVEAGLDRLNERVDGLAADMRQRFRHVDDRLAELARESAA